MSSVIYYEPEEVWDLFNTSSFDLTVDEEIIAEDHGNHNDVVICITMVDGFYEIIAYGDADSVSERTFVFSESDCTKTVFGLYEKYFSQDAYDDRDDERDDDIAGRESDIDCATDDFLYVLLSNANGVSSHKELREEIFEECKEFFLRFLYERFDIDIYRPSYLEDASGKEYYTDFPYKDLYPKG